MNTHYCKICGNPTQIAFHALILKRYHEPLYKCEYCGFLSVGEAHWLEESYQEAINISDTGIISRNLYLYPIASIIAYMLKAHVAINGGGQ